MIDIQGIKEALPHRYPMLLVDRVLEVSEDTIVAIKKCKRLTNLSSTDTSQLTL